MQIMLKRELAERLARLPESGMGYQIVDLMLRDGSAITHVPVLNAQVAEIPDSFRLTNPADIIDFQLLRE